jgi:diguanylate cyclase (GGDEF)-like protein
MSIPGVEFSNGQEIAKGQIRAPDWLVDPAVQRRAIFADTIEERKRPSMAQNPVAEPLAPRSGATASVLRSPALGVATAIAALGGVAALATIVQIAASSVRLPFDWVIQACLSIGTIMLAWRISGRHGRDQQAALRQLSHLAELVRTGQAPIEDLNALTRHDQIGSIALSMQNLLRDLRVGQRQVAQIEAELHQRVANRTDALQRSIAGLRTQALRDGLTGLCNRRMLDENLPELFNQCVMDQSPMCLLMIDVDHFKLVNDSLGHSAGDELLKSIGQLIRSTLRDGDLAFRYGGDEFVILMPGSHEAAGTGLAERLTTLVDSLVKPMKVSPKPRLSVGVSCIAQLADPTPEALLRQADAAAYAVKRDRKSASNPLPKTLR